jgi:hypothetical protein
VILFAVIAPPFVDRRSGHVPAQIAVLGLALLVMTLPFDLMYVIAGGTLAKLFQRRPAVSRYQQTVVGAAFVVLAVLTAVPDRPASGDKDVATSQATPGKSSVDSASRPPPVVQASSTGGGIGSTGTRPTAKPGAGSPTTLPSTRNGDGVQTGVEFPFAPLFTGAGAGFAVASVLLMAAAHAYEKFNPSAREPTAGSPGRRQPVDPAPN